jgi:hypothetical protein
MKADGNQTAWHFRFDLPNGARKIPKSVSSLAVKLPPSALFADDVTGCFVLCIRSSHNAARFRSLGNECWFEQHDSPAHLLTPDLLGKISVSGSSLISWAAGPYKGAESLGK